MRKTVEKAMALLRQGQDQDALRVLQAALDGVPEPARQPAAEKPLELVFNPRRS